MSNPRGVVTAGSAPAGPADGRSGIRHAGGLSLSEAGVRNVGTWSTAATGAAHGEDPCGRADASGAQGRNHASERSSPRHRDGAQGWWGGVCFKAPTRKGRSPCVRQRRRRVPSQRSGKRRRRCQRSTEQEGSTRRRVRTASGICKEPWTRAGIGGRGAATFRRRYARYGCRRRTGARGRWGSQPYRSGSPRGGCSRDWSPRWTRVSIRMPVDPVRGRQPWRGWGTPGSDAGTLTGGVTETAAASATPATMIGGGGRCRNTPQTRGLSSPASGG
jgi:hypothetical protein